MQYFQVGEEVILQSKSRPEFNGEYVFSKYMGFISRFEFNGRFYNTGQGDCHTYKLDGHEHPVIQQSLRKKHKGGESFESLMSSIKDGTLEALDG